MKDNKELSDNLKERIKDSYNSEKEEIKYANERSQTKKYAPPTQPGLRRKKYKNYGSAIGTRRLTDTRPHHQQLQKPIETTVNIPKPKFGEMRILVFGGVGEIGKNTYALEYNDEIVILDCGYKFSNNQDEDYHGIKCIVANLQYLIERKEKIKAMCISHGHLDHIGGIPIALSVLNNPPIYSRELTIELIKKQVEEYVLPAAPDFRNVEDETVIKLSDNISLKFFSVTHTIPDAMGIIVETPTGNLCFTGDLKLSHDDCIVKEEEEAVYRVFEDTKILVTMADSTNAEKPGFSISEARVIETIDEIVKKAKGMVIMAGFSSQIDRSISIIQNAVKRGKKIFLVGRGMLQNLLIANELGMLDVPANSIISEDQAHKYPREKIFVLCTGAQGEEYSGLDRMSRNLHKHIFPKPIDTVIFSSSIVPGNERGVQSLKDRLSRLGVSIVTYETSDVHSSGHANAGELEWIHKKMDPKFFIPIHGYHYMLTAHGRILQDLGMDPFNIVLPNNGSIIDITADGNQIIHQDYKMPSEVVVIDGNAVGPKQDIVIRDRKRLAEHGFFVIIININQRQKRVRKSPDIVSRGFTYLREAQDVLSKARIIGKKTVEEVIEKEKSINIDELKQALRKEITKFLRNETQKQPIVVPVIFLT